MDLESEGIEGVSLYISTAIVVELENTFYHSVHGLCIFESQM